MSKPEESPKRKVTPKEIVEAWETSESAAEAAERLGMRKEILIVRISEYRRKGVLLKAMPKKRPSKVNVDDLNKRIAEIREELGKEPVEDDQKTMAKSAKSAKRNEPIKPISPDEVRSVVDEIVAGVRKKK